MKNDMTDQFKNSPICRPHSHNIYPGITVRNDTKKIKIESLTYLRCAPKQCRVIICSTSDTFYMTHVHPDKCMDAFNI